MPYTLSSVAERSNLSIERIRPAWAILVMKGWVEVVGIDESGEWLYEPTPRLAGLIGRN